jgi:hypothetical protein
VIFGEGPRLRHSFPADVARILHIFLKTLFMSTQVSTMPIQAIANRLAEFCSKGDFEAAQNELYADDCISIEPHGTPEFEKETQGLAAIKEKGKKWEAMVEEAYGTKVSAPLIGINSFAVTMTMDIRMKGQQRMAMTELCVYNVKDGKIVSELFFM